MVTYFWEDGTEMDLLYNNNFGYPVLPNSLSRTWSKFVINLHDFRILCQCKGSNFKTIQEQLGQSHVTISIDTYNL